MCHKSQLVGLAAPRWVTERVNEIRLERMTDGHNVRLLLKEIVSKIVCLLTSRRLQCRGDLLEVYYEPRVNS